MIAIKIEQNPEENYISLSTKGSNEEIGTMIAQAMVANEDLALIIFAAIPCAIDGLGRSRTQFCEIVMKSKGLR